MYFIYQLQTWPCGLFQVEQIKSGNKFGVLVSCSRERTWCSKVARCGRYVNKYFLANEFACFKSNLNVLTITAYSLQINTKQIRQKGISVLPMFTLHKCLSENCFPCNTTYLWCTCIALVRRKFALKKCVIISFHWLWKIAFMINIDLCVWVLLLNEVLSSYVFWSGF